MKIGKLMLGMAMLATAILIIVGMVKFASVLGFLMVYPYVVQVVTGYGLNSYLAQAIGLVIGAALWFTVIKLFFVWQDEKRILGTGILVGFYVLHLLVMFLLPGDALVHPTTGERKFCTVDKVTGRIITHEQAVYDKYGQRAARCTTEQVERFEIERQYTDGENPEVDIWTVNKGFISPATGQALFHYCHDQNGRPRFFVLTGFCPWSGGKLLPVTVEVVKIELAKAQGARDLAAIAEKKRQAAVEREKNLKIIARQQAEKARWEEAQKREREKTANIEFSHVSWGNVVMCGLFCMNYGVEFFARETNGVSASLNKAVLRMWVYEPGEAPQLFKKREPMIFEWDLKPAFHVPANKWYSRSDNAPGKSRALIDLRSYEQFFSHEKKSWLEITLIGEDAMGHRLQYTLE